MAQISGGGKCFIPNIKEDNRIESEVVLACLANLCKCLGEYITDYVIWTQTRSQLSSK